MVIQIKLHLYDEIILSSLFKFCFFTTQVCQVYGVKTHMRPDKTCTCKVVLTIMSQACFQEAYGLVEALTSFLVAC